MRYKEKQCKDKLRIEKYKPIIKMSKTEYKGQCKDEKRTN